MASATVFAPRNVMSRLKQQARQLKRRSDLSHTEALEFVATEAGHNSWKEIVEAVANYAPFEQARINGLVVVFDSSECPNPAKLPDDLVFWSHRLDALLFHEIREWWSQQASDYEDDQEQRPNGVVLSKAEIHEACSEMYGCMDVFIVSEVPLSLSVDQIMDKYVHGKSFFMPRFTWVRGKLTAL